MKYILTIIKIELYIYVVKKRNQNKMIIILV